MKKGEKEKETFVGRNVRESEVLFISRGKESGKEREEEETFLGETGH